MAETADVGNLYQYLVTSSAKLAEITKKSQFVDIPTFSVPTNILENEIVGANLGVINQGYLNTRFGKLIFKSPQEKYFIQKCESDSAIKQLSNCPLSIPFVNDSGKISTFAPSFEVNGTQLVDVVNCINTEQRLKNFWIQEYLTSKTSPLVDNKFGLKDDGLSYKVALLDEVVKGSTNSTRPSFHQMFMNFAKLVAKRSVSQKLQVGSVITSTDFNIIFSFGYNGDEKGGYNQPVLDDTGQHEDTVHAEYNALIKLDFNTPHEKIIYVTHFPCLKCARGIINANIKLVLYGEVYKNTAGIDLLRNRGVRVVRYEV
jgi:dCMP deaminase